MHVRSRAECHIGCAGWAVPASAADRLPGPGTHLQRFARVLGGAEINTSFYRPHQRSTYVKWAESAPAGFRFAVKLPREITHERRLGANAAIDLPLERFLGEVSGLGDRLGPLLVQLPPSLGFTPAVARGFFVALRRRFAGAVVCEPRHPSWFTPAAERALVDHRVARVAADPAVVPAAAVPGGRGGLVYLRMHGSPRMYYSAYEPARLDALASALVGYLSAGLSAWCIFDNTAAGAAAADALALQDRVHAAMEPRARSA